MNANSHKTYNKSNMNRHSNFMSLLFFICFIIIKERVAGWGYREDNCFDCFADETEGPDTMYFCRHNTSGLIWGQCCRRGSASDPACKEMYDS